MKKFYANFKSVVAAVVMASMTLAASCSYDDSGIKEEINEIKQDLTALTERVAALEKRLGDEVAALTELINGKVVVTSVEKVGDATTVTLSDGTSFTVYPECGVVDTDTDTNTYISIAEEGGVLYFAVYEKGEFKEWLLINGEKVPVYDGNDQDDNVCDDPYTAVAPQFQVNTETGEIEVSIDGGQTWVSSGLSASATGAQLFTGVKVNDNNTVTFTLVDGTSFDVVIAELIEFNTTRGQLYVKAGETKEISVTINDAVADVNVMNQPLGWKAEIALAENNEEGDDNLDDNMGVLAVGGTEFVLKVTGPSQDFINAGFAEEKGYITVHFNSDNGACKVGKVAVELASIVLDVTKEGMVTVTSTWVDEYLYSSWAGEELIQEFNNYYVCIMPLEYYVEDLASIYNASWWEFNVPCVGGWINNFFYNVNEEFNTTDKATYVVGENEKWTFQASVEDIIGVLDWSGTLSYEGNSFAVIIVPTDPQSYGTLLIDQALVDTFKQVNVNVEVTETAWNEAYLNATLRGANAYHFNIENKDELNRMIENGWYADIETYYNDYIYYWQNYNSQFGGYTLTQDVVAENIKFNDLINYGEEYPYLYELAPNSTYIVAILVEEEGKTEYTYEDLIVFEFTTEDLVAATEPFEYTIVRNDEDCTYFKIFADVTVSENVVAVYSAWLDEEILEPAELKDYLVENGWCKNDFSEGYTYELNTTVNQAGDEKYLSLLLVDAEGNYSVGSESLASKEVVVNEEVELSLENVEFLTEGGVANITLGGLEGVEFTEIKAYVIATDGSSYYMRSEEDLQDLAYGSDYLYRSYSANPFLVAQTADYKYVATEGKTYIVAVAAQLADGTVTKVLYEQVAFTDGEVEEPEGDVITFTSATAEDAHSQYYGDYKKITLANDAMTVTFGVRNGGYTYLPQTTYGNYWDDTSATYSLMDTYTCWSWDSTFDASNAVPTLVVSLNDEGKYKLDMTVAHYSNAAPEVKAVYEGDINGIGYEGEGGEEIATVELTSAVATAAGSSYIGGTGYNLTFSDGNGTEIVYMVQTLGNTYLKEGAWNDEYSWNQEGYINSVTWTNVNTAWPYTMTVAVVDGQYDITLEAVDYYGAGQPTLTAHYAGQIEGFTLPGEGGEEPEEPVDAIALTISEVAYNYLSQYNETEVYFTSELYTHQLDFKGKMTETEFIPEGTYSTADDTLVGGYCYFDKNTGTNMSSASCVVTHTNDGCHFEVEMTYDGKYYTASFTYTPATEDGGDEGGETDGAIILNTLVGSAAADSYSTYFHVSDGTGNNEVKFVCENTLVNEDGFIYDNSFPTYQSSVSYIFGSSHFSFVNKSLIVNGKTYANSDVSNASAEVANGVLTINFTVGGTAYTFKYDNN